MSEIPKRLAEFLDSAGPPTVSLTSGTEQEWTLPKIDPGYPALSEVRVEVDPLIAPYISFDSAKLTFSYDG